MRLFEDTERILYLEQNCSLLFCFVACGAVYLLGTSETLLLRSGWRLKGCQMRGLADQLCVKEAGEEEPRTAAILTKNE